MSLCVTWLDCVVAAIARCRVRLNINVVIFCLQDLELALRRFESGGLAGIVELEGSVEAVRKTHMLIEQAGLGVRCLSLHCHVEGMLTDVASCNSEVE